MHSLSEIAEDLLLHPVQAPVQDDALGAFSPEYKGKHPVLIGYEFYPSSIASELWSERSDDIFFHTIILSHPRRLYRSYSDREVAFSYRLLPQLLQASIMA